MNKKILSLAVPNIVSNISVPLLNLIDLAILGHLGADIYIGAVALGGTIFNFIFWTLAFLRMGTSGMTAQAYGRRDLRDASLILARSMFVAFAAGFLVVLLQIPIAILSFKLMLGSELVELFAQNFFYIKVFASPAAVGLFALSGWFIAMQNSSIPMIIAIVTNVLNIAFSLLFVFVFKMKADGVALSSVFANYLGLILAIWFVWKYYRKILKYWDIKAIFRTSSFVYFFTINKDIFIRMLCVVFTFTFFTNQSASLHNSVLAANAILLQFLMFFSYLIDGFAYAGEALVGKFVGSKSIIDLKQAVSKLFLWGSILGLAFSFVYFFAGQNVLRILTSDSVVISTASKYLIWAALIPLVSFATFTWDGIYIGATASVYMRNTMLIATFGVFMPVWFFTHHSLGNTGLWLAMVLFMLSRGLMQTFLAKKAIYSKLVN